VLSKEELGKLLKELPQHAADIVTVAYYTGMRAGEIFNLTWDRVNMKDGCFTLTPKDTKITYRGNPVRSIKSCLTRGLERAGIEDFRFHDLRHTFVSNARKAGVDRTVIMKLTGHKTLSIFTRYNTVDQADAREAVNRLDDFLAG